MPQIFQPRANALFVFVLFGLLALAILGPTAALTYAHSSYVDETARPQAQPVPFSHQHHVGEIGLDCRYCHNSVEQSSFAGLPATEVCMTCHSQLFTEAAILEPVRTSFARGVPIRWNRVNWVPDFVYFNHAAHVNNGVGCTTCHGPVDQMPLTWRAEPLSMQWCLDCHRDPGPNLRPPDQIFATDWQPAADRRKQGAALLAAYHVNTAHMTDCYVCHR